MEQTFSNSYYFEKGEFLPTWKRLVINKNYNIDQKNSSFFLNRELAYFNFTLTKYFKTLEKKKKFFI